jgi:histone H3
MRSKSTPKRNTSEGASNFKATARTEFKKRSTDIAVSLKKRRYHPGTVALREIRKYQKSTDLLLNPTCFARLVREVTQEQFPGQDFRFTNNAIPAVQSAAEAYMTKVFSDAMRLAVGNGRVTLLLKDIVLQQEMSGDRDFSTPMQCSSGAQLTENVLKKVKASKEEIQRVKSILSKRAQQLVNQNVTTEQSAVSDISDEEEEVTDREADEATGDEEGPQGDEESVHSTSTSADEPSPSSTVANGKD